MTKPVNLTVHKNTAEKRKRREASGQLVQAAKDMASEKQVRGYAIVTWDKDCENIKTSFEPGPGMTDFAIPEFVKSTLVHCITKNRS